MSEDPVPESDALEQRRAVDPVDEEEARRLRELQRRRVREHDDEAAEADLLEQTEPAGTAEEERAAREE